MDGLTFIRVQHMFDNKMMDFGPIKTLALWLQMVLFVIQINSGVKGV